jgi:hypothetical protein
MKSALEGRPGKDLRPLGLPIFQACACATGHFQNHRIPHETLPLKGHPIEEGKSNILAGGKEHERFCCAPRMILAISAPSIGEEYLVSRLSLHIH